ncbi:MAG: ROK family protein [Caldilineaceae bacterium]|nr:ROK family protein [Caldilineaceae bacterium]
MNTAFGGIEAGGTKFVCAVGTGPDDIRAELRLPTESPDITLGKVIDFFRDQQEHHEISAVGVASFGPVDPDPDSQTFGYITNTPKPGWANTPVAPMLREAFDIPIGFDTDVNVAALGEHTWGAASEVDTFVYLTIGTGIGGGGMVDGKLLHGLIHPEMGHIAIPHNWGRDAFAGTCPFHGDCWEGLANGPAIEARWGQPGELLPPAHEAWSLEAHYLALGVTSIMMIMSPQLVVMGGGVMEQQHIFPLVHREVKSLLNGYIQSPTILEGIDSYIVPPALGGRSGVLGAIALANRALQAS